MYQQNNRWIGIAYTAGVVFCILFIVFVFIQFRSAWIGPVITLDYPQPGEDLHQSVLVISGTTQNIAQLFVHGLPVPIQLKTNRFATEIALPIGVSSITLDGFTRSGRHRRVQIPVRYTLSHTGVAVPASIELLRNLEPEEVQFRPTSDLLDSVQNNPDKATNQPTSN